MQKNNKLKKLKLKKEKKKRKTPQNCKSPMQRQRFMITIKKNVTEEKEKTKFLKA